MAKAKDKDIIAAILARKEGYYGSAAYSCYKEQCEAVLSAVDQKYRPDEQTTRSGFYLATHTALYENFLETASQVYMNADPLFVWDEKRMGDEELALKGQRFHNRIFDAMGEDNKGGIHQWMNLVRDVPIYTMGVSYQRWNRVSGIIETPKVQQGLNAWEEAIDWTPEYNILQNEPEIERHHPFNYFCEWRSSKPMWEGIMRRWGIKEASSLLNDENYRQDNLKKLIDVLVKNKGSEDKDFHTAADPAVNRDAVDGVSTTVYEYWGDLTNAKGMEDDAIEYQVIFDSDRIYRMAPNKLMGFRPLNRTMSMPHNDIPFGRGFLAPSLPHTKMLNLSANLGIDSVVARMHNGVAVWEKYLQNPNQYLNPKGVNGVVYMTDDAPKDKMPRAIGDQRSGALDDLLKINNLIRVDKERTSQTDQGLGVQQEQSKTATEARLLAAADSSRSRSAIINMAHTGLLPIGKQILMLALRNIPEMERRNLSYDGIPFSITNEDVMNIWNNQAYEISDSILNDESLEAMRLTNFLGVARDVLLQDPRGLPKILNIIRDAGRKSGLKQIDKYFPDNPPPQVNSPVSQPQPQQAPLPAAGGIPQPEPAGMPEPMQKGLI